MRGYYVEGHVEPANNGWPEYQSWLVILNSFHYSHEKECFVGAEVQRSTKIRTVK